MIEAFIFIAIGIGAVLGVALVWAIFEILLGTGRNRQRRDPTLNAFQQPLRKRDD